MTDYFDYPQDERDTRVPDSKWLRLPVDCDDCGHQVSQHSSEGGLGCLYDVRWLVSQGYMPCPCLRPGTSRADQ